MARCLRAAATADRAMENETLRTAVVHFERGLKRDRGGLTTWEPVATKETDRRDQDSFTVVCARPFLEDGIT